jgi:hypothetical protein
MIGAEPVQGAESSAQQRPRTHRNAAIRYAFFITSSSQVFCGVGSENSPIPLSFIRRKFLESFLKKLLTDSEIYGTITGGLDRP